VSGLEELSLGNITPDPSGIANYNENAFIKLNRTGKVNGVRELNPAMLWRFFGTMTDEDLTAIFAYLKTLPSAASRQHDGRPDAVPTVQAKARPGRPERHTAPAMK
jgi:hypothetical protein